MKKLRVYIDTSVIGGYFDDEFSNDTKLLFESIKKEDYKLVISDLTEKELIDAPENVKTLLNELHINFDLILVTQDSIELANEYLNEKVVGQTSLDDCIHIATATINKVDLLASWNFKHIVNIQKIRGYNSINIKNGFPLLEIRSPKDLISYED